MLARKSKVGALVVLCMVCCVSCAALVLPAAPAFAEERYALTGSIGKLCASEPCGPGQLKEPTGVAVNDSTEPLSEPEAGDVYVTDTAADRVERFSGEGTFLSSFDGTHTPAGSFSAPAGIAVDDSGLPALEDPSAGDVYVVDEGHNVVDRFSPTGAYLGQLTESPGGHLGEIRGVAVDPSGNVWIYEARAFVGNLDEYDNNGNFVKAFDTEAGTAPGVAVDSAGDVYAVRLQYFSIDKPVLKLEGAGGGLLGQFGEKATSIAVNPATEGVFVDQGDRIVRFGAFAEPSTPLETFAAEGLSESQGIAVNGASTVFAAQRAVGNVELFNLLPFPTVDTEAATEVSETTLTLHGTVNPEGKPITDCHFEIGATASYGQAVPCAQTPGEIGEGSAPVAVTAVVTGLAPASIRHFRLDAANENGFTDGEDLTVSRPLIEVESVSQVTGDSATLDTRIDPTGLPTTYHFEYGPDTGYGASVPVSGAFLGAGTSAVALQVPIEGLLPGRVYHYRVVAANSLGATDGADRTFSTQGAEATGMLDGRQWELVSPPDKHGGALEPLTAEGAAVQAAEDGSAMAYAATAPIGTQPQGNRSLEYTQVVSKRQGGTWATEEIATPNEEVSAVVPGIVDEYRIFSTDLSVGLLKPNTNTLLSPQASAPTPYLREPDGTLLPLVNANDVPAGTEFGNKVDFVAGTPDLSHVVLSSSVALTGQPTGGTWDGLYEWTAGVLKLVSVLPDGEPTTGDLGSSGTSGRNAISHDGGRVVFTASDQSKPSSGHLFLRDVDAGETVQLDIPAPGAEGGSGLPAFQIASGDDSRIFFTDTARLTPGSTAGNGPGGAPDLYMCEVHEVGGHLACALTDLTVDEHAGESASVSTFVIGASEDGSLVYFIAGGRLAPGAVSGAANLYVENTATAQLTLVAKLTGDDSPDWGAGSFQLLSSRVSPNGRYLAFMSDTSLTGYDNADARSGHADEEVFLYDDETGRLVCASCNPTGARPDGLLDERGVTLVDKPHVWSGRWIAGLIPSVTRAVLGSLTLYQSRYLSNDGRLFFDGADGLVPRDVNGFEDVYEYEPGGVGTCTADSGSGCVDLLSSGTSREESAFMDASASGDDVFFLTGSRLAQQDLDEELDIYDAHACSTSSPCPASPPVAAPPCATTEACRSASAPQPSIFGEPASATFAGAGNLTTDVTAKQKAKLKQKGRTKRCKAGSVKRKGKCFKVKTKTKTKSKHRTKSSSTAKKPSGRSK
jgi:hypothetical protein